MDDFWKTSPKFARALAPKTIPAIALELTQNLPRETAEILAAIFANSPFLTRLAQSDSNRLTRILAKNPNIVIDEIATRLATIPANETSLMAMLRQGKNDAAMAIAFADLMGLWDIPEICQAITAIADMAVESSVRLLFSKLAEGDKITPDNILQPQENSGYFILAMGKHGAGELNYSSDIDLIVLYDPAAPNAPEDCEIANLYIRLTRRLIKILSEHSKDGYVFRTDLRLRPDPGVTPIAISVPAALGYYESQGQNWERAAYIKARVIAGDIAAGKKFLANLTPYIWRRHLDFAAISDIHAIKRQINSSQHSDISVAGHNVKLGRGGIREIEFFVQTQQLITGGREPNLRKAKTLDMLECLHQHRWIDKPTRDDMQNSYVELRRIEHRLQMINDEQTQSLPATNDGLLRVAQLSGFATAGEFSSHLHDHLQRVQQHYNELFEDAPALHGESGNLVFTGDEADGETLETLMNMGFEAREADRIIRGWHHGRYRATRTVVARERLTASMPIILKAIADTPKADETLKRFDRFLQRLPAGIQFFGLINSNANLMSLLLDILGNAPRLAEMILSRVHCLDAVLDPAFFAQLPACEELRERLHIMLAQYSDIQSCFDAARIFCQEQSVLIATRLLREVISANQAAIAFSDLAEMLLNAMFDTVFHEFSSQHGTIPNAEIAILALGKLGAREMTAGSDLDLVLLYDAPAGNVHSDGVKPLNVNQYFARLTQRLVASLSAPTAQGALYEVDLRLRPSGKDGPLATSFERFVNYHTHESWTWEKMALTRARIVAGGENFTNKINSFLDSLLRKPYREEQLKSDVNAMRRTISHNKDDSQQLNIKTMSGGLIDIEFIVHYLTLAHGEKLSKSISGNMTEAIEHLYSASIISSYQFDLFKQNIILYHSIQHILRLALNSGDDLLTASDGLKLVIARSCGLPDIEVLLATIEENRPLIRTELENLVGKIEKV